MVSLVREQERDALTLRGIEGAGVNTYNREVVDGQG